MSHDSCPQCGNNGWLGLSVDYNYQGKVSRCECEACKFVWACECPSCLRLGRDDTMTDDLSKAINRPPCPKCGSGGWCPTKFGKKYIWWCCCHWYDGPKPIYPEVVE